MSPYVSSSRPVDAHPAYAAPKVPRLWGFHPQTPGPKALRKLRALARSLVVHRDPTDWETVLKVDNLKVVDDTRAYVWTCGNYFWQIELNGQFVAGRPGMHSEQR